MFWLVVFILVVYFVHKWVKRHGGWGNFWGADPPKPFPGPGWGGDNEPRDPLPKKWPGDGPPDVIPDWVFEEVGPVFIPKLRNKRSTLDPVTTPTAGGYDEGIRTSSPRDEPDGSRGVRRDDVRTPA